MLTLFFRTNNTYWLFLFILCICMHRFFTEAVFDIYNCEQLCITNSSFSHNRGSGVIEEPFRGNTGAVAVGFHNIEEGRKDPIVRVSGSNFTNNTASNFRSSNEALGGGILVGRGGGMGVWMIDQRYNISVLVSGCLFEGNMAEAYAGGLYFLFSGGPSQHSGIVEHTRFLSNHAESGAGAFACVGLSGLTGFHHTTEVRDCLIQNNRGNAGAGIYFSMNEGGRTNLLIVERSVFIGNSAITDENGFGAALATDVLQDFREKESFNVHSVVDW